MVSFVVAAEVQKRGTAKAVGEFPFGPRPRAPMIGGPGKLRVARVPRPQIKHALHAEQTARFPASAPIPAREAEAELLRRKRLEAIAVAESTVKSVVVRPGQGPIVAAFCRAANCFSRRPPDFLDDRTRRWGRRHPCR